MVKFCCAFGCNEKFIKGGPITFHCFPKDETRRKLWESKLKRENFKATNYSTICSRHFSEGCFEREKLGGTWLKKDAVPTIFDFPSHLKREDNERKAPKERIILKRQNSFEEQSNLDMKSLPKKKRCCYLGDFDESDMHSPTKAVKVLQKAKEEKTKKNRKLKALQQQNGKLKKRVASLEQILKEIKKKSFITDAASDVLELSLTGPAEQLLKRTQVGTSKEKYPAELRAFALTLQFYSNKAYEYVRRTFSTSLPHPATLRRWCKTVEGNPGFTHEAFITLKQKSTEAMSAGKKIICCLIVDEISIRKHIEWDGDKFSGYVDLGTQLDNDCLPPAKQALIFMLNALNANWKIPVAYFLIHSLNALERSNLISECLRLVFDTGVEVTALTFDGTSVNISTANNLGAKIQEKDMKPYFPHPITSEKVFVILDVCHMLNLVRNTLASKGSIVNQNGDIIKWDYIKELEKFQKDKGLYAAPKLKSRHIEWYQEKMKVKLAAQVLSNSVADALLYLANDLKLEEFQGCEATVEFLKIFNNLFDVLNSRNFL
ncbi:DNA transposase THAP9, partial [Araneus ventricosus]